MKQSFIKGATFAVALVAAASLARAESVLIDFGNGTSFRGATTSNPDPNGNSWNSVDSSVFWPGLIDKTGAPTNINFGFSSASGTDYFNGPSGATQDPTATVYDAVALGDLGVNEAVYDYYVNSTFEIQNLDPTKLYHLTFYGSHKFNNDNVTRYTVYTDDSLSTVVDSIDLEVGVNGDHNQNTVVTLTNLSPQAFNILYVGFEGASGGNGYLNALRIDVVPEPASLMLLGVGGLALIRRRR